MRSLQSIYPSYKEQFNFIIVGQDLGESPQKLQSFSDGEGYPWDVYVGNLEILKDYRILSQDTKLIIGKDGVIVSRGGYTEKANWKFLLDSVTGG